MTEHEASRTLVKSPPELWDELSDEASLAGHLAEPFGEIRITRLEPETTVAWEGERASGTVRIEPSGWGTRVTLTARAAQGHHPPAPAAKAEPEPAAKVEPPTPLPEPPPPPAPPPEPLPPAATEPQVAAGVPRRGLRGLLRGWRGSKAERLPVPSAPHAPAPAALQPPAPAAPAPTLETAPSAAPPAKEPPAAPALDPHAVLVAVLDRLGAAHHRPFSRS